MSVQPLSDLVIDVVKAADATRSREVINKLHEMASGDASTFAAELSKAANRPANEPADRGAADKTAALLPAGMAFSGATLTGLRNAHALTQRHSVTSAQPSVPVPAASLRKFEGMMLSQFVDAMMPAQKGVFGAGLAGSTWKSLLTEKLGNRIADAGGIGMATRVARAGAKYTAMSAASGVIS